MRSDFNATPYASDRAAISRRALLKSGAALGVSALYSLNATSSSAWAANAPTRASAGSSAAPAQIDEIALRRLFAQTAKGLLTPGAAMILRTPNGALSASYGDGTLDGSAAINVADHARIGSVTKTFTGTVIHQLAQEGRLRLGHAVSRYRPNVPNGQHITIRQLLNMRSGLYNYSESRELNAILDRDPTRVITPDELLAVAFKQRRHPVPGKQFEYSNTNTVLLGQIAEQLDGQPLAEIFQQRLFTPLGMHNTVMPEITSNAIPHPHTRGYMYGTNVSTLKTEKLPPRQLAAALAGTLKPNDVTDANPSWAGAAGAAISTAEDMARWGKGLVDGSLLNPIWQRKRLDSVRSTNPTDPAAAGYGLAIGKFGALYGHTGELPGFQTFVGYDPDKHLTLVVWTNLKASPQGHPPAATIAMQLIGMLYT
jgi:D-alanyl-D-alanine carboxypeptidase